MRIALWDDNWNFFRELETQLHQFPLVKQVSSFPMPEQQNFRPSPR